MSKGGITLKCVNTFAPPERERVIMYNEPTNVFHVGFRYDGQWWDQAGNAYHGIKRPIEVTHWCELPFVPVTNQRKWEEAINKRIDHHE